ncbi:conserved hypothetical protein [Cenarchaeum symbiosum A]|uniref:NurA domain-containing protein n=1 Tax=Cenarchaeum symbiosum (strain A) TaxID=414004 RepID=A0RW73_CENSY|nr:conserved hypothetical protein [Cenarchaeum symbiosum A]
MDDPVRELAGYMGEQASGRGHLDGVLGHDGTMHTLDPSGITGIGPCGEPRKMAFVDGGSALLYDAPGCQVSINRTYYSLFRGGERLSPRAGPRLQFFSCVTSGMRAEGGETVPSGNIKLFPYGGDDARRLPEEADLVPAPGEPDERSASMARKFAEWRLAERVIEEELGPGDVLVMDGSLQTSYDGEDKYADRVYRGAAKAGVTVCGLSKQSRLVTASGEPLLDRVSEIAAGTTHDRWYLPVGKRLSENDKGFVFVVRLHPASDYIFRFEIFEDQYASMSSDETDSVLSSLAANSDDLSMPGYPYGAVDADRFAQVRNHEAESYRSALLVESTGVPGGDRVILYGRMLSAHGMLNRVTS